MLHTRIIQGNKETCFSIILNSVLADIQTSTNKTVDATELTEGYTYLKPFRKHRGKVKEMKVEITKFKIPYEYEATFYSAQGNNTLRYQLEDIDDHSFRLSYEEDFSSNKGSANLNFKFMSKLFKRSTTKKMNAVLECIEHMVMEDTVKIGE